MKETIVEFHLFIRAQSSSQMKLVDAASKAARRPSLDGVAVTGPVVGEPIPDHDPAIVGRRLHLGKQRVPLLIYEYMTNGSLDQHVFHQQQQQQEDDRSSIQQWHTRYNILRDIYSHRPVLCSP